MDPIDFLLLILNQPIFECDIVYSVTEKLDYQTLMRNTNNPVYTRETCLFSGYILFICYFSFLMIFLYHYLIVVLKLYAYMSWRC